MILRVRPLSSEDCHYINKKQILHLTNHLKIKWRSLVISNLSLDELRVEMVKRLGTLGMPVILALGRQRQGNRKFKTIFAISQG